jgi:hypothetical protein
MQGPHQYHLHLLFLIYFEVHPQLHLSALLLKCHCVVDEGDLLDEAAEEGDVVLALLEEEGVEPSFKHAGGEVGRRGRDNGKLLDLDSGIEVALCEDLLRSGGLIIEINGAAVSLLGAYVLHFG